MLLTASNVLLLILSIAHCIFLWVIVELFEIGPPVVMVVLYISVSSSKVVNHIYSKVVTLVSCTQVLESLVDRRESLGQVEKLLVENLDFDLRQLNDLLKGVPPRDSQIIRGASPVNENLIVAQRDLIKSVQFVDVPKVVLVPEAVALCQVNRQLDLPQVMHGHQFPEDLEAALPLASEVAEQFAFLQVASSN